MCTVSKFSGCLEVVMNSKHCQIIPDDVLERFTEAVKCEDSNTIRTIYEDVLAETLLKKEKEQFIKEFNCLPINENRFR